MEPEGEGENNKVQVSVFEDGLFAEEEELFDVEEEEEEEEDEEDEEDEQDEEEDEEDEEDEENRLKNEMFKIDFFRRHFLTEDGGNRLFEKLVYYIIYCDHPRTINLQEVLKEYKNKIHPVLWCAITGDLIGVVMQCDELTPELSNQLLFFACYMNYVDIFEHLLKTSNFKLDFDFKVLSVTPLSHACKKGHKEILDVFLSWEESLTERKTNPCSVYLRDLASTCIQFGDLEHFQRLLPLIKDDCNNFSFCDKKKGDFMTNLVEPYVNPLNELEFDEEKQRDFISKFNPRVSEFQDKPFQCTLLEYALHTFEGSFSEHIISNILTIPSYTFVYGFDNTKAYPQLMRMVMHPGLDELFFSHFVVTNTENWYTDKSSRADMRSRYVIVAYRCEFTQQPAYAALNIPQAYLRRFCDTTLKACPTVEMFNRIPQYIWKGQPPNWQEYALQYRKNVEKAGIACFEAELYTASIYYGAGFLYVKRQQQQNNNNNNKTKRFFDMLIGMPQEMQMRICSFVCKPHLRGPETFSQKEISLVMDRWRARREFIFETNTTH